MKFRNFFKTLLWTLLVLSLLCDDVNCIFSSLKGMMSRRRKKKNRNRGPKNMQMMGITRGTIIITPVAGGHKNMLGSIGLLGMGPAMGMAMGMGWNSGRMNQGYVQFSNSGNMWSTSGAGTRFRGGNFYRKSMNLDLDDVDLEPKMKNKREKTHSGISYSKSYENPNPNPNPLNPPKY